MIGNFEMAQAKLLHRLRFAGQTLFPPKMAVVGAYHYENVGDMALASAGRTHWPGSERPALQTSANISKWPGRPISLVCGGAIITDDFLTQLRRRFQDDPKRVALIGVERAQSSKPFSEENVTFLRGLPYFSLRNHIQAGSFDGVETRFVPDVVFSRPFKVQIQPPVEGTKPVLGMNVTPGTGKDKPITASERETIRAAQKLFFRTAATAALDRGWQVVHIPFGQHDDARARDILTGLPVQFARYDGDPESVMSRMGRMSAFVPSRYHALIFALLAGLPVTPFFYARKNYWLASDFLPGLSSLGFREILDGAGDATVRDFALRSYNPPEGHLDVLRAQVLDEFRCAFHALLQHEPTQT